MKQEKQSIQSRIVEDFENDIKSRRLKPRTLLPSYKEIAEKYGCSLMPVKMAMNTLKANGYVSCSWGEGVYVEEKYSKPEDYLYLFEHYKEDMIFQMIFPIIYEKDMTKLKKHLQLIGLKNFYVMWDRDVFVTTVLIDLVKKLVNMPSDKPELTEESFMIPSDKVKEVETMIKMFLQTDNIKPKRRLI